MNFRESRSPALTYRPRRVIHLGRIVAWSNFTVGFRSASSPNIVGGIMHWMEVSYQTTIAAGHELLRKDSRLEEQRAD
jgi:hypothetical protein